VDTTPAPAAPSPRSRALDVLRGLAMLGVVAVHTLGPVGWRLPPTAASLVANAARGVQLFVVISVVLALGSLEQRGTGSSSLRRYWFGRWLRLAPLFYMALAATLARDAIWPRQWPAGSPPVDALNVGAHFAFLHALSPAWVNSIMGVEWTIGLLALFYLAAPLLRRLVRGVPGSLVFLALTAAAALAVPWLGSLAPAGQAALWNDWLGLTVAQLPVIAAGFLVWHADRALSASTHGGARIRLAALITGLLLAAVFATGAVPLARHLVPGVFGLAWAAVVVGAMRLPLSGTSTAAFAWLGRTSYGTYLFHMLVLQAAVAWVPRLLGLPDGVAMRLALLPAVLVASAAISWGLAAAVEGPVAEWGRLRLETVPPGREPA
jgi:peptidoglycan/LPS O-acetylase OafA/YrhL